MDVVPDKSDSIQVQNGPYRAVVRRSWTGSPKTWRLTEHKAGSE